MGAVRLVLFATLAVTAVACIFGQDPNEGRPCTPLSGPEIVSAFAGEDDAGVLRIAMHTGEAGECFAQRTHWLGLDGGVEAVSGGRTLDTTRVNFVSTAGGKSTYGYAGQASLVFERPAANAIAVTVDFAAGPTFTRACTTSTGRTVACQ